MRSRSGRQLGERRERRREPDVYYVVEIDGWDGGYSLSLNTERDSIDPFHEFRHLQVLGGCCTRND